MASREQLGQSRLNPMFGGLFDGPIIGVESLLLGFGDASLEHASAQLGDLKRNAYRD